MKTYNLTDKQILEQLEEIAKNHDIDLTEEIKKITKKLENSDTVSRVWEKVELARHTVLFFDFEQIIIPLTFFNEYPVSHLHVELSQCMSFLSHSSFPSTYPFPQ